jgi:hypothetical protein
VGETATPLPAEYDPCLRRARGGLPCARPSHHHGPCAADADLIEAYRLYVKHLRERAQTMKLRELENAAEYHRIAWRVLKHEYDAR